MNLRIVSIFLLFLFGIVIVFPGYGSSARANSKNTIVYANESESGLAALKRILKKCLVKGINMVEEQRSTEEEDEAGHSSVFEQAIFQWLSRAASASTKLDAYRHSGYQATSIAIFTPPDCFFS